MRQREWAALERQWMEESAQLKGRAGAAEWLIERLLNEMAEKNARIGELEDSLRARTLAELRAVRPVAMPQYPDDDEGDDWGVDPTGLFRDKLPPLTPAEQAIADALHS